MCKVSSTVCVREEECEELKERIYNLRQSDPMVWAKISQRRSSHIFVSRKGVCIYNGNLWSWKIHGKSRRIIIAESSRSINGCTGHPWIHTRFNLYQEEAMNGYTCIHLCITFERQNKFI